MWIASTGLSLSVLRVNRGQADTDEWYPCKDHGCGCSSAEICRTNCCCFPKQPVEKESSCCDADHRDEPKTEEPHAKFTLVIRAASCSGDRALWVLKHLSWQLPQSVASIESQQETFKSLCILRPFFSQSRPALDPPPPRA